MDYDNNFIENQLCDCSVENWLIFMDNERLHIALSSLRIADVDFLLALSGFHFNQTAFAKANGVSKQLIQKRFQRIRKKILKIF